MLNDSWKYVSVGKCVAAIVFAVICACVVFVPFTFANGITFTYSKMPVLGDGGLLDLAEISAETYGLIIPDLSVSVINIIATVIKYSVYAYFIVVLADVILAVTLLVFRLNGVRILFNVLSIISGFVTIICAVAFLAVMVAYVILIAKGTDAIWVLKESGVISFAGLFVLSICLTVRQFKNLRKPY